MPGCFFYLIGNVTACSDLFSLSYDGINTTSVSMNNLTAETLQQALNNLTSIKEQGKVNATELIKSQNSTAYRVIFYFKNPEETRMLLYNSVASNITSVEITRLQKGKVHTEVSYPEPSGFSVSSFSLRESHKPKVPWYETIQRSRR